MNNLTHIDLFAGIGGFSIAAHLNGFKTIATVENNAFCTELLQKRIAGAYHHKDIHTFNTKKYEGRTTLITGGFPCQPFSVAGKRIGTEDDRYLWPQMLRVIREIKPQWVVAENVRGLTSMQNGLVFEQICTDLEVQGYSVQSFVIPAIGKNAVHKRDRVWIIANAKFIGQSGQRSNRRQMHTKSHKKRQANKFEYDFNIKRNWDEVAAEFCRMDARIPDRMDRLAALGNAIFVPVAYEIIKAIKETIHQS